MTSLHRQKQLQAALRLALTAALVLTAAACRAQDEETPAEPKPPAPTPWEGAIGLTSGYRPEYSGASRQIFKLTPALFLRYGRFTITNASGFVTRRADDVVRGLGLDMVNSDRLRVNLALRFDAGRAETTSAALAGMGDVKSTVRARMTASYRFDGPWRLGASWSVDAFGRGGGNFGDVGVSHETQITPLSKLTLGSSLTFAGDRYMQTYFGVSNEQAARTAYPVYTPNAGFRDANAYANLRHDIGNEWTLLAGGSVSRLLGPAAVSPLTTKKGSWSLNGGFARRF